MKKAILSLISTAIIPATVLCGCNKSPVDNSAAPFDIDMPVESRVAETENNETKSRIEITFGGQVDEFFGRPSRSGVQRHFYPDRSGTYVVEYVHVPYGVDKDETLDYKLTLNNDNTYTMTVVSEGITAEHYGHWYERHGSINIYYDEPMDDQQHNIYISDSLYGEMLPYGKIMIYDKSHTIVLAKQNVQEQKK